LGSGLGRIDRHKQKGQNMVLPVNEYQLTKDKTNYQGEWL
jgi:hypothetical protein